MIERPVSAELRTALVNNEPLQYAHLIKFERPSRPDSLSGRVSTSKQRYTYLTDASINVAFDDGSIDLTGIANGVQTYLANKVLSVGSMQETTKASTSSTTLVLDGTGLGASLTAAVAITNPSTGVWDIAFSAPVDTDTILDAGFREGDKVKIDGIAVNIQSFRSNNTLRVTQIDSTIATGSRTISMVLASEEIISVLLNKNADDYASFINREVFIYKAYFRQGTMVGTPVLMFKGIIYNVGFEDSEDSIKVSWGLTSHWGDFAQVRGRITSDSAHRALDENGIPQVSSALKPIYAYDKGFVHSEVSINTLATYTVQVEKMDVKSKKGFFGIGSSVKTKKYFVPEDRNTNLDFEFNAKAIPVVYGVRLVDGIGIFADTLNDDSSTIYVASVLSEGEIGGIYDVLIDGNSLICNDKADFDARSTQTPDNTVELICRGRSDRGDVLGGQVITGTAAPFYSPSGELLALYDSTNYIANWSYSPYLQELYNLSLPQFNNKGLLDGETISLTSPQAINLDFFSGKTGQKASSQLSTLAFNKKFKIQNNYWTGSNTAEYWGPNHRLVDTAYVVGKFKISEGETTIPEIKYIIRGKVIDCYNYDYSYSHDVKASSESASNFKLGDTVSLYRSDTNAIINSNVRIIDKWTLINPDGTENVRFRFSSTPSLIYDTNQIPTITKFYMRNASAQTWTMVTHNYEYLAGSVAGPISAAVTSVSNVGGKVAFNYATNSNIIVEGDPTDTSPKLKLMTSTYEDLTSGDLFRAAIMVGTISTTQFTSQYDNSLYGAEASALFTGNVLASMNTLRLSAAAVSTNDFYNGSIIEVTRYNSLGRSLVQSAEIIGYDGTTKIATIDSIWDFIPTTGDTFRIFPKYADSRVSTNTAIQLLDYVTSPTYGRSLDKIKDLDLSSWLETARKCDERSNVTALFTTNTNTVAVGDVYRLTVSSTFVWEGTVVRKFTNGTDFYLEFSSCIGKLSNKWNDWKSYNVGDIIYTSNNQFFSVQTAGTITSEPTATNSQVTLLGSLSLSKVSGSGPSTLSFNLSKGNFVQSLKNGAKISGYSLYDADDINYWRMSGWEEHSQRYVTKHQTNLVIDTATPLFDNINSMLDHFNGIMRYSAGKYYLDIEEIEGAIASSDIRTITADDIIGKIQLSDEGTRSAFNSLTAAFADPSNKFEARSISFFNSDYLKADRNVPKKGNLSVPGITNYYNTRLLADSFLTKSRYGLSISFTVRTHGILFLAGTVIQLPYARYGWDGDGKKFRIETVTYQPDGLTDIVAREYDDSFYGLSNMKQKAGSGATTVPGVVSIPTTNTPNSLVVSQDRYNQIILQWDPGENASPASFTEIWRSNDNNFNNASVIALVPVTPGTVNEYVDPIAPIAGGATYVPRYYWVRRKILT